MATSSVVYVVAALIFAGLGLTALLDAGAAITFFERGKGRVFFPAAGR
jgi:hypothetical protein